LLPAALPTPELDDLRFHHVGAHRPPEVDDAGPAGRSFPSTHAPGKPPRDQDGQTGYFVEILGGKRPEVLVHERLAIAHARHFQRLAVVRAFLLPSFERHLCLLLLRGADRAWKLRGLRHRTRGSGDQTFESLPLVGLELPEGIEASVEGRKLLDARGEHGAERAA